MGKILGLDYGEQRIGIAISDDEQRMAVGVGIIENVDTRIVSSFLKKICDEEGIVRIVVGLPLNMKGERTKQALAAEAFGMKLEDTLNVPAVFHDERLSTRQVARELRGLKKPKGNLDREAARLILQSYLDRKHLH